MSKITLAVSLLLLTSLLALPALAETAPELPTPEANTEASTPTTSEATACEAGTISVPGTPAPAFMSDPCVDRACNDDDDCTPICTAIGGTTGVCAMTFLCPNKHCLCQG